MSSYLKYFDSGDVKTLLKGPFRDQRNAFEKEVASYLGARHAIGTSYGRTALYLGLKAIGAEGSEVFLPAFTCTVVRQAVVFAGATPRFIDVDFETLNLDLNDLRDKLSTRTKAIVVTHYFGRVARNLKEVLQFARENHIVLIEDCAHSLGAEFEGRKVGTFGDLAIFSLTKNMINFGGGFLVTNDKSIAAKAREILRQEKQDVPKMVKDFPVIFSYGLKQMIYKLIFDRVGNQKHRWLLHLPMLVLKTGDYIFSFLEFVRKNLGKKPQKNDYGQSISMASIIASLGRNQLKKIDTLIERRKRIYEKLARSHYFHFQSCMTEEAGDICTHFVLRFSEGDIFKTIERCRQKSLSLLATWPTRQKKWRHLETKNMWRIEKEILVLTLNPDLTNKEIGQIMGILGGLEVQEAHTPSAPRPIEPLKL